MPKMYYYGDKISPNMAKTKEGYLICLNVPIARTGDQEYLASEIGLPTESGDKTITVHRKPEEVFSDAAVASFEGKPVADNHPTEDITPDNYTFYTAGHAQNVRRGAGESADKIVADLFISDPRLISEIESGAKRDISCGYNCEYVDNGDGTYSQTKIRGNHVAVVDEGRAGKTVSIHDAATKAESKKTNERGTKIPMTNAKQGTFRSILHLFAGSVKDAKTTDEIEAHAADAAAAIEACGGAPVDESPFEKGEHEGYEVGKNIEKKEVMKGAEKAAEDKTVKPAAKKATDGEEESFEKDDLLKAIHELTIALADFKRGDKPAAPAVDEDTPEGKIDAMLAKLTEKGDEEAETDDMGNKEGRERAKKMAEEARAKGNFDRFAEEESMTVPAEEMKGKDEAFGGAETPEEEVEEAESRISRDTAIKILKNARPAVAAMKDPAERKRVTDALLKSIDGGKKAADTYERIFAAARSSAQSRANDSASKNTMQSAIDASQKAYDAANPHISHK